MSVDLRKLSKKDLPLRVRWMNDPRINSTLNINLPVTIESTTNWFDRASQCPNRADFSFVIGNEAIGMGGFTDIDMAVRKAELYIFISPDFMGRGFGYKTLKLLCDHGFNVIGLNKIYLHTNDDNIAAIKLYEKFGFKCEGYMPSEIMKNGVIKGRYYYGIYKDWSINPNDNIVSDNTISQTDIHVDGIDLKIVRDDLFPFIGGGVKARKALEYEKYMREHGYNACVTTGGIQSNHNRAIALICARNGWKCHIVYHGTPERFEREKGNALIVRLSGAEVEFVDPEKIGVSMDSAMERLKKKGYNPYYIHGGGHDVPGGEALVNAVRVLKAKFERESYKPDYIFVASGTGSTQAGIAVGLNMVGWNDVKLIGISVARQLSRGKQVIVDFANMLSSHYGLKLDYADIIEFNTDYLCGGYENYTPEMDKFLTNVMANTGVLFDTTYSGKAFYGMMDIIKKNNITGNILFWHTGGLMNLMK